MASEVKIRKGDRWIGREENLVYGAGARAGDFLASSSSPVPAYESGGSQSQGRTRADTRDDRIAAVNMRSSQWTGRRSLDEQCEIIAAYAPVAASGAAELIAAIRAARLNDPSAEATLHALKDLHEALGNLIRHAEVAVAPKSLRAAWEAVEKAKGKLLDATNGGTQAILVAPVVAYGTATVLGLLSGQPVTGEMLAILTGAVMARHSLMGKQP